MSRKIKIVGIRNEKPDTKLYVLALIALARQLQEEDAAGAGVEDIQSASEDNDG